MQTGDQQHGSKIGRGNQRRACATSSSPSLLSYQIELDISISKHCNLHTAQTTAVIHMQETGHQLRAEL